MTKLCPVCQFEISDSAASCPQCGFKFLEQTLAFNPVAIEDEPKYDPKPVLRVVKGANVGTLYKLKGDNITLGRNPSSDIFLNDMTVSREHAIIKHEDLGYVVYDDDSFNGVWVNNKNISEKVLKPGDILQIGKFAFIFDEE